MTKRTIWLLLLPLLSCSEPDAVKPARQRIELMPTELDFGDVPVLGGRVFAVEVENRGQASASVQSEIDGPFEVEPEELTLPVGATIEVAVRFRPQTAGAVEGGILFRTADGNEALLEVRGRGVERALRIEPEQIDFGELRLDDRQEASFTLRSVADGALDLLFDRGGSQAFEVDTHRLHLPGQGEVTLSVAFEPQSRGTHAGWLEISPCVDCRSVRIDFVGKGISEGLVAPAEIDFGEVPPTLSHRVEVSLYNDGDASTRLDDLRLEPAEAAFEMEFEHPLPHELAPRERLDFAIVFRPEAVGAVASELLIESSYGERRVPVEGRGGGALLGVEPLDTGPLPLGFQGVRWATIRSLGEAISDFESLELVDPSGTFSLPASPLPPEVGAGGLHLPLQVEGKAPGIFDATLRVHTGLRFQPVLELPLRAHIAEPGCELRFDPPGPIELGMVDGQAATAITIEVRQEGEGECVIWEPRLDDGAMELVEGAIDDFLLLEPGERIAFRFEHAPIGPSFSKEVSSTFLLSHSQVKEVAEIPLSFLLTNPLPFAQADVSEPPDTPVGRLGIGWMDFQPNLGEVQLNPPYEVRGAEAFSTAGFWGFEPAPLFFRPTSAGPQEATLASWWRGYPEPYLHPVGAEALDGCPAPCDWPVASCSWELEETTTGAGHVQRRLDYAVAVEPEGDFTCFWLRDNGSRAAGDCGGGSQFVPTMGGTFAFRAYVYDAAGRADSCEVNAVVPPLGP